VYVENVLKFEVFDCEMCCFDCMEIMVFVEFECIKEEECDN